MIFKILLRISLFFLVLTSDGIVLGKVYSRCELAWELYYYHNIPQTQLATWVCIASQAKYNTKHNNGKGHGIYQINEDYWMKPCDMGLGDFFDDSISDDTNCAKRIHRAHTNTQGDGFLAWGKLYEECKTNVDRFIEGCFSDF